MAMALAPHSKLLVSFPDTATMLVTGRLPRIRIGGSAKNGAWYSRINADDY
jgi:hypothetical protein